VVKVDAIEQQRRLGFTFKSPRWAVAFKFPAAQATTRVNEVVLSVGRTGAVTPVAKLDPVECGGVTLSSASLHNFDEIKRLGLKIGDWVLVERAGEVIPKVIQVILAKRPADARPVMVPGACPACGGKIARSKEDEVIYRCLNSACPLKSKKAFCILPAGTPWTFRGWAKRWWGNFLEKNRDGHGRSLSRQKDQLLTMEGFKEKKAENLLKGIAESKTRPSRVFCMGWGFGTWGRKARSFLAEHFGSLQKLMEATEEELRGSTKWGR
jgi:DNA ligase (NAD+)